MSIIVEALFLAFTFVCYKGFRFGFIVSRGCLPLGYPGFGGGANVVPIKVVRPIHSKARVQVFRPAVLLCFIFYRPGNGEFQAASV